LFEHEKLHDLSDCVNHFMTFLSSGKIRDWTAPTDYNEWEEVGNNVKIATNGWWEQVGNNVKIAWNNDYAMGKGVINYSGPCSRTIEGTITNAVNRKWTFTGSLTRTIEKKKEKN